MKIFEKIYMGLVLFFLYVPVLVLIVYSFNSGSNYMVYEGFSLKWYGEILKNSSLMEALKNSIILAFSGSVSAGIIGTLGAYAMSRGKLFMKNAVSYVSILTIMIPEIILGMVYMAFFSRLDLGLGMGALIIAHSAFCIPYVLLMVRSRLALINTELEEAAYDLGAGKFRTFMDIILPQLVPAIVSGMLLAFAMSFDDVIISIFLTGSRINTLPVKINSQLKTIPNPEINVLFTIMLVVTLTVVILLSLLNRKGKKDNED